ncbi:MAG: nitroreductase family protein, partial [Sandaracinaceae bacterium]
MDSMELLETRSSNGKLGEPAPSAAVLDRILTAALRAPDHGAVRPWRILLVRGEARNALGEVFADALSRSGAEESKVERARKKPLRAPLIIVVAATPCAHPKAPECEQVLSAGAVAHTVLLGLHAAGFAGMWRTGALAYDDGVKEALGLSASDH